MNWEPRYVSSPFLEACIFCKSFFRIKIVNEGAKDKYKNFVIFLSSSRAVAVSDMNINKRRESSEAHTIR